MKKAPILLLLATVFSLGTNSSFTKKNSTVDLEHVYAIPARYDCKMEDEPSYSSQSYLNDLNIGTTWDEVRGENVTVAIIDSGINYLHEDFYDINGNTIISNLSGVYSSNNVKTVKANNNDYSILNDTNGHGTNVAGVIASQINQKGCAGIAPNVHLMILKTTDYSFASINKLLCCAADNKADIINMSFTAFENTVTYGSSTATGLGSVARTGMASAIDYAYRRGCTLVAAGGNYNTDEKAYPANLDHVIAVGSLAKNSLNTKAGFSNIGTNVDIVAPGYVYVPTIGSATSYKSTQGTSFSTPMISSIFALYQSKYPNTKSQFMETKLYNSAVDLKNESQFGNGRVDATAFLADAHVDVTGLEISSKEIHLKVGEKGAINARVLPENATNQEIIYLYDESNIASIDNNGNIEALSLGKMTVEVYSEESEYFEEVTIIVEADEPISVSEIQIENGTKISLYEGEGQQLNVSVLPENAEDKTVNYSVEVNEIADVTETGYVRALKVGTTKVHVTSNSNPSITASIEIEVLNQPTTFTPTEIPTKTETQNIWKLVDDASTLKAGDQLVLAENTQGKVASTTISNNVITPLGVTFSDDKKTMKCVDNMLKLTLGGKNDAWTLTNEEGKLLGATANKKVAFGSGTTTWKISIDSSAKATIQNTKSTCGKFLYNSGSPRFTTYTSSANASMLLIQLYRLETSEVTTYTEVGQLMKDIQEADFCMDYSLANGFLTRYQNLSEEDKTFFENAIISTEGTTYLERLYFFANKANQNQLTPINFSLKSNQNSLMIFFIIGIGLLSIVGYSVVIKKKKYQ